MKQPGYTAGVTSVYRKYLDLLFEKGAENYRVAEEDKRYLLDLFNRGGSCTGYYQMQNGPSMMAFSNEKKTGDVSPVLRKKKKKFREHSFFFQEVLLYWMCHAGESMDLRLWVRYSMRRTSR